LYEYCKCYNSTFTQNNNGKIIVIPFKGRRGLLLELFLLASFPITVTITRNAASYLS
jgi:hypothetical protein